VRATRAIINLDLLKANYQVIRRQIGTAQMLAMVKANAYGHGMITISRAMQMLGVDMLGVAYVDEAIVLRNSGIVVPIVVLTPNEPHEADSIVEHSCTAVACTINQARYLQEAASKAHAFVDVHMYVDTGMHREGFLADEVISAATEISKMSNLRFTGACTHFATSDEPDSPFFRKQLALFENAVRQISALGITLKHIHAANTDAVFQEVQSHFTLIRPGLSLYGYSAAQSSEALELRPVMSMITKVIALRAIGIGESVSYGRKFVAKRESQIATIPVGYGDGYTRRQYGKKQCIIGGRLVPIVGAICMDECMVDVTGMGVAIGDPVVLLGTQAGSTVSANDLADWSDTIPYEIITAVSGRIPRIFEGQVWNDLQSYMDVNV